MIYYLIINVLACILTVYDKLASKHHLYRIRETSLFLIAGLGGAFLMYASMLMIHHKTRKKKFMIILPMLVVIHSIVFYFLI
ncbi:MAG: DUF1294 domain-containing protein [Erysipelotrichaceae bacterium]|nr:DUF1294 domain-containing protein [Erysipelotrichaceae bacterium]